MKIPVQGLYSNGNAFVILARCRSAAQKAGWSTEKIEAFCTEAKASDFDHLIQTVMQYFEESDE